MPTLASSKLALCSLSRWNRNESTGRSFEIPAIGTGLLAEYTEEHQYLYGDGVGAALFRDRQELVEKARYYLSHTAERQTLAANGHRRTQELGLSWADHIRREWRIVERWLTTGDANARRGRQPILARFPAW
jgi:spore maturation protein CgeB